MIEEGNVTSGRPTNGASTPYVEPLALTPRRWAERRPGTTGTELPQGETDETAASSEAPWPREASWMGVPGRARMRLWQEAAQEYRGICVDPSVMRGQPVIVGTRIPVYLIVSLAAEGRSAEEIVDYFEGDISLEHIREALHFAADLAR